MQLAAITELISLVSGSLIGGFLTIWSKNRESRREKEIMDHEHMMAKLDKQSGFVTAARESPVMQASWVRRCIALLIVVGYLFGTKVVPVIWPDVPVAVSYSVIDPETFFGPEREMIEWVVVNGIAVTPLDSTMMFAILGMFFGYEIVRKAHR